MQSPITVLGNRQNLFMPINSHTSHNLLKRTSPGPPTGFIPGAYHHHQSVIRPELVRPVQAATSVIRISPNPRQWTPTATEQPSVILQNALTNPTSQAAHDSELSQIPTGTLYCVLPQNHEKNLMIIKNEVEDEKCKDNTQPFQRQVTFIWLILLAYGVKPILPKILVFQIYSYFDMLYICKT